MQCFSGICRVRKCKSIRANFSLCVTICLLFLFPGGLPDTQLTNDEKSLGKGPDIPWFLNFSQNNISLRRKELSRERKQIWVFKNTQGDRVNRLVKMCAQNIGADATIEVFGRLGRETGVKEYKALLETCFDKAKMCDNEEASSEHLCRAFQLFKEMKEQGFQIEERIYGPFFMHLIDKGMVEEFQYLYGVINDQNPRLDSKLGYYEMLLWIRVNNKEKIQELCNGIVAHDGEDKPELTGTQVGYALNFCYLAYLSMTPC